VGGGARFNGPTGVAVDGSGNVYVADTGNSTIRKITAANGTVTTFAGASGVAGSSDGVGAAARFNAPQGIAIDSAGNIYIADTNNSTIRKITSGGAVTTLAGSAGLSGSADGQGSGARFDHPSAVAVDSGGNVYVADFRNAMIRKITVATGTVSTLAGFAGQVGLTDGIGGAARFNQPYGVAVDGSGNVFVADTYNRSVRKITAAGAVTTLNGMNSRFYYPQGIATDGAGNLYVADGDNQSVSKGLLVVSPPSGSPVASQTVTSGLLATFTLGTADAQTNYQWQVSTNAGATWASLSNNSTYGGATTVTLTVANTATAMSGYLYRTQLTNAAGTSVSAAATLTVSAPPTSSDARLFAIACRAFVGTDGNVLIPGIIVSGSGPKQVIVRASGPALIPMGVTGTLAQPQLRLYSGSTVIAENIGWSSGTAANTSALQAAFTQVGLSQFPTGSTDCALLATLTPGAYTAIISGANNATGVALVEVYELGVGSSRLSAMACRAVVGTGGNVLIPGIIITGTNPKQLIIRGGGPMLTPQGVAGALAQPQLQLFNGAGVKIAENIGWSTAANASDLFAATVAVGLTPFPAGSADCAMLVTLPPGLYTAMVSGVNGTTGVGLIEVYEAP
jgi:sugar lactone lactonase YvrE